MLTIRRMHKWSHDSKGSVRSPGLGAIGMITLSCILQIHIGLMVALIEVQDSVNAEHCDNQTRKNNGS